MKRIVYFMLMLASACSVKIPENTFACTMDSACPSGWHCARSGYCQAHDDVWIDAGGVGGSGGTSGTGGTGGTGGTSGADAQVDADVTDMDSGAGDASMADGGDPLCDVAIATVCDPDATCVSTNGTALCSCPTGFLDLSSNGIPGTMCADIDECAAPTTYTNVNLGAAQADTRLNANDNSFAVTGSWERRSSNFGAGSWNDNADLCGGSNLTRDAVFRISLSATTTVLLTASGTDKLAMAIYSSSATMFSLSNRALDASGTQTACLSNATTLSQTVTLAAGNYYVVVKAHAFCINSPCLAMPNEGQDDPFYLEVRDTAAVNPCSGGQNCTNTDGGYSCL